jgi:hypothetical protein
MSKAKKKQSNAKDIAIIFLLLSLFIVLGVLIFLFFYRVSCLDDVVRILSKW